MSWLSQNRSRHAHNITDAQEDQLLWQDNGKASMSAGAILASFLLGAALFLCAMVGIYYWLQPAETNSLFPNADAKAMNPNANSKGISKDPIDREALDDYSEQAIKIYFTNDGQSLKAQTIDQPKRLSDHQRMLLVLEKLLTGPTDDAFYPTVPKGVELRAAYIRDDMAILDFDETLQNQPIGGPSAELLCAQAIVLSLTRNIPAIRKVRILIDAKTATTLWDQVDLSAPLAPDLSYIQ